ELGAPGDLTATGDLLVGLRPQDLHVAASGPFRGTVTSVERLGFDGYAYLSSEAGPLAARFEGSIEVGASVALKPGDDTLPVVSPDGARALRHPEGPGVAPRRPAELPVGAAASG